MALSSPLPETETAGLAAGYFRRTRLLILLATLLAGAGLTSYVSLTKELNPNIQIPIVFITTVLPGAGPEDVEELVTIPIEDAVRELDGVTKATSTSQENLSVITVEFASSVAPETAKQDAQSAIDAITTLPDDAENPNVQVLDFQNQPNLILAITASNGDSESLKRFVDQAKDDIKDLPGVERVEMKYRNAETLSVSVSLETLLERALSLPRLSAAIGESFSDFPSGTVAGDTNRYPLSVDRTSEGVAELAALPVTVDSVTLPLGTLADVRLVPPREGSESYVATGTAVPTRAITLSIFKSDEADTTALGADVTRLLETLRAPYGDRFAVYPLFDGAREIEKSFNQLFRDFSITFALVFVVLLSFFGFRESLVAAAAIPLTFLGTFTVMLLSGISVNFISLFSLLLALGILVDNAIVIVSAVAMEERKRHLPASALALKVFRDFRVVILTTTLTTVWAFLPLLLASGIIGEFIKPIPIVVSTALALSALIALFLVLPFMALFIELSVPRRVRLFGRFVMFGLMIAAIVWLARESSFAPGIILLGLLALFFIILSFQPTITLLGARLRNLPRPRLPLFSLVPLAERYERFMRRVLADRPARRRTIAFLVIFMIFSYALVPLGFVKNEFFPEDDQETIYVSADLPTGTPLPLARKRTLDLLEELRTFEEARFVSAEIGAAPPTDNTPGRVGLEKLLFTVRLAPKEERDRTSGEIVAMLNARYGTYPYGRLAASQLAGGPPAGSDITVKFLGDDFDILESFATKLREELGAEPGLGNIRSTSDTTGSKIAFHADHAALARYRIAESDIALILRAFGTGLPVKKDVRIDGAATDITLFLGPSEEADLVDISHIRVPANGALVPLETLGTVLLERTPTVITREDGKRVLTVTADVAPGYPVSDKNARAEELANALSLPAGYSWKTGGANEENQKSVRSILLAMLLSAALIFGTMSLQFDSFRKALIVILVIPLAVSGVFVVFALTGTPLSFPALIGILALFGIVVNNSIIMVDKINKNMDAGLPLDDAIAEGAGSRLEPILLTALTTIVGLIPITLSDPIWQGLGGAIIAGLTFSGIAKLFFIPVIYKAWFSETER